MTRVQIHTPRESAFDGRCGIVVRSLPNTDEREVRLDDDGGPDAGQRVMFRKCELRRAKAQQVAPEALAVVGEG